MSVTDWAGYLAAVSILFVLGGWLHSVSREPADDRIESLAIWAGGCGIVVIGVARLFDLI